MANMEAGARAHPARRLETMAMAEDGPTGNCADADVDTVSGNGGGGGNRTDSLTMFLLLNMMRLTPRARTLASFLVTLDVATVSLHVRPLCAQTLA